MQVKSYTTKKFESQFTYSGSDLGSTWSVESTRFRLWAPTATAVSVNLYKSGTEGTEDLIRTLSMVQDVKGT